MLKLICWGVVGVSILGGAAQAQHTFYYTAAPGHSQPGVFIRIPQAQRLLAKARLPQNASTRIVVALPLPLPTLEQEDTVEPKIQAGPLPPVIPERTLASADENEPQNGKGLTAAEKRTLFEQFERWLNQRADSATGEYKSTANSNALHAPPCCLSSSGQHGPHRASDRVPVEVVE